MSRRSTAMLRAWCMVALLLGMVGFLKPQAATAAAAGGMFSWGGDDSGSLCLGSLTIRQLTPQPAIGAAYPPARAVPGRGSTAGCRSQGT